MAQKNDVLRVQDLTKQYGHKEVLKDASLSVKEGEIKVLIGPSGAGKSTLLQCINFLVIPDQGRIWLEEGTSRVSSEGGNDFPGFQPL